MAQEHIRATLEVMSDIINEYDIKTEETYVAPIRGIGKVLDETLSQLRLFEMKAISGESFDDDEMSALRSEINELQELKGRYAKTASLGMRSFSEQQVLKFDTIDVMNRAKANWSQKYLSLKAAMARNVGVPNYKFKIGESVKIGRSNRSGKVVGIRKDAITGSSVYTVRMSDLITEKEYGSRDLRKSE